MLHRRRPGRKKDEATGKVKRVIWYSSSPYNDLTDDGHVPIDPEHQKGLDDSEDSEESDEATEDEDAGEEGIIERFVLCYISMCCISLVCIEFCSYTYIIHIKGMVQRFQLLRLGVALMNVDHFAFYRKLNGCHKPDIFNRM